MSSYDAQRAVREAVATLDPAVLRLEREHGCSLGVTRLTCDAPRLVPDLDVHHVGPDEPYDQSMWSDAEFEGFGAPDRHAP